MAVGRTPQSTQEHVPTSKENPVFTLKILNVDRRMEQKGSPAKEEEITLKIGDPIIGKELGKEKRT